MSDETPNEFKVAGSSEQQMDALKLFAYSRNIPGAPRPELELPGDNVPVGPFAKSFWTLVKERGVFRRDVHVVLVNDEEKRLDFVEPHMLLVWADDVVECFKKRTGHDSEGNATVRKARRSMPVDVARGLLAEVKVNPRLLVEVEKVNYAPMPVLRRDGRVEMLAPGYDLESKTFTFDCGFTLDEEMTLDAAHAYIRELLKEFPFGDGIDNPERSLAVQVACLMTLFGQGLLSPGAARPMFIFNANAQRSGKSLLAKMALYTVFGQASSASWSDNKEEFRKALETAANTAAPYVFYDNVRCHMANADLERFVTSPDVTCRVMGKNTEQITVPNVATVLITANQATTSTDIAERALFVNLFVDEADPQARKIESPIDEVFLRDPENRRKLLSALWAMVKAWVAGGKFKGPKRLVGFEQWSAIIGGIVCSSGFIDPLERPIIEGVGSTEAADFNRLVVSLITVDKGDGDEGPQSYETMENGARAFTFNGLAKVCADNGLFDAWVPDDGDMSPKDRSSFGKKLKRYVGKRRMFTVVLPGPIVEGKATQVSKRVEFSDNGQTGRARRFMVVEVA